jgi:retron-type reverse transcriptase
MATEHKNLQVEIDSILRQLKAKEITPEVARIRIDCVRVAANMLRTDHEREMLIARMESKAPKKDVGKP